MTFVDTSALVAEEDANHSSANAWWDQKTDELLTTDYVIDELLTLLRARGQHKRSEEIGEQLFAEDLADIRYLSAADVQRGWDIYRKFSDKAWSFTDCTSYAVMEKLGITHAWAYDVHFRQFGFVSVVPN